MTTWKDINVEPLIEINFDSYKFVFRHLFMKDRDMLFSGLTEKLLQEKHIKPQDVIDLVIKSFALRLVEYNGNKLNYEQALDLFSNLPIPVLHAIDKEVDKYVCGPDTNVKIKCSECQTENIVNLLTGLDFFRFRETIQFTTKISGDIIR
jgi:hypothetical protein